MFRQSDTQKIIFSGGGSGGPVIPLLAVAEELLRDGMDRVEFIFVGTHDGPERAMVADFNQDYAPMRFIPLISGKWRRYFSWLNFLDIFKVAVAFFISLKIIFQERPSVVISAGGFVSVPLVWAAALFRVPIIIHQQDLRPGLANRLMAPFAQHISVTFEKSLSDYGHRAVHIGNPTRSLKIDAAEIEAVKKKFNLLPELPLLLVSGGGTGATGINRLLFAAASELGKFCQIIHIVGPGKKSDNPPDATNYQFWEILPHRDFLSLLILADLVVSRAGLASLSELSVYHKAVIMIPMPCSHQEDNAALAEASGSALVLHQAGLSAEALTAEIKNLLADQQRLRALQLNISNLIKAGAVTALANLIRETLPSVNKKI